MCYLFILFLLYWVGKVMGCLIQIGFVPVTKKLQTLLSIHNNRMTNLQNVFLLS